MNMTKETIAGEFKRLDGLRQNRLDACEKFAYYTIPSVYPRDDNSDSTLGVGMLDSIGSAVVNHFANKLVTTLFSPNRPFFRLIPSNDAPEVKELRQITEDPNADASDKARVTEQFDALRLKFVTVEKDAVRYLEKIGYRTSATNAAKLLIVTGDVVIRSKKGERSAAYSMRDYVCVKDLTGTDVVLIVRDSLVYGALTPVQRTAYLAAADSNTQAPSASTTIVLYTKLELQEDRRYKLTQAIENHDIPDTSSRLVTAETSPFTHLSWNLSKGENYGRGPVEDFSGSFHMIDSLTNYQAKLAGKMSDIKILVDPQSGMDINALNSSESGTYVAGKPGDVQPMSMGAEQGLQYLEAIIQMHKRQLSAAFLYQSGQTRDAERVTAEEIRENAAELEIAHGGVYSRFASEWQTKVALEALEANGEDLGDVVEPEIMTGMDSLSRTGEMQAIRVWMDDLTMMNNVPDEYRAIIKSADFAQYAAIQRGVEHGAFVMSKDEIKAAEQAAQERETARMQDEANLNAQGEAQKAVAQNL